MFMFILPKTSIVGNHILNKQDYLIVNELLYYILLDNFASNFN